jgi:RNA polymerase subunit RPABC4/transcription elongation factor Spt4
VLAASAVAEEGEGTVRGTITIVGQERLSGGEVVVSYGGTDEAAGTVLFDSDDPGYSIDLPAGEYDVYAWAKVFHSSDRVPFTVVANGTTWVNLTVVRIEEYIGTVQEPDGTPVAGAVIQFFADGVVVGATNSDGEGRFRELIDPGTYEVRATIRGYEEWLSELTVEPGQVIDATITLEPIPEDEDEDELPVEAIGAAAFILLAVVISVGYVTRQVRRVRRAALEAEAGRAREWECPECSAMVAEDTARCPECGHTFSVRCDECGRSVDAGTAECPECGGPLG